jgi:glutamate-1-semialdehyde 2,1-aminomutase
VKDAALSDTENMSYLLDHARRYPNAKLILAHCGRAFASWTVMDCAARFADLPNVFFDLSGICEPAPMMACIRAVGAERILWGSDFPISSQKGKAISLGSGFLWLLDRELERLEVSSAEFVLYEELRAFSQASLLLDLTPSALESIFYKNARTVFGL